MQSGVYRIVNTVDGKCYVGSTNDFSMSLSARLRSAPPSESLSRRSASMKATLKRKRELNEQNFRVGK